MFVANSSDNALVTSGTFLERVVIAGVFAGLEFVGCLPSLLLVCFFMYLIKVATSTIKVPKESAIQPAVVPNWLKQGTPQRFRMLPTIKINPKTTPVTLRPIDVVVCPP